MKKMMLSVLMLYAARSGAEPYLHGIWRSEDKIWLSQGSTFMPRMSYDQSFTNMAVLYHPLSAGSIIPARLQPFIPPESWAVTIGGGYLAQNGQGSIGFGVGVNLLDSVRAYLSHALISLNFGGLAAIGYQIAPGNGPLNLFVSRQENINFGGKFVPRWFIGASYGF